jgi:hypothetical protein
MPITLNKDSINFGNYSISLHPNGIEIDGKFKYASSDIYVRPFQGTISGYTSGGYPSGNSNVIDKFSFSTDANATDVGDLSVARRAGLGGQSSGESGYTSGGMSPASGTVFNTIDKFPFAADGNATDVGDLTQARKKLAGQSSSENGYSSGGDSGPSVETKSNVIDKFPFASNANATDVGDLTDLRWGLSGQSSTTHGYSSGGVPPSNAAGNVIDKFPFASNANATDVGDLTSGRRDLAGQSSSTHGYATSGNNTTINKFSFASDGNATTVGSILPAGGQYGSIGQSSTTNGYSTGGSSVYGSDIQKFSFAVDGNAADVASLTVGRYSGAGQQI